MTEPPDINKPSQPEAEPETARTNAFSQVQEPAEPESGRAMYWVYVAGGVAVAFLLVFLLTLSSRHPSDRRGQMDQVVQEVRRDELFDYAVDSLNRQEEFDSGEMLKQAIDRLDRWVRSQRVVAGWKPDPMLETLPEPLRKLPALDELDRLSFKLGPPAWDGQALQQAVWLRDLSNWARGDEVGDVERAERLFDWVVRNIQLDPPLTGTNANFIRVKQKPWETLVFGHGSAKERAWVFILLARQQGLDAAMIGPAGSDSASDDDAARLVGLLSGNQIYLFDPELGLPVPAPDGVGLDDNGRLKIKPATLAQVVADDALLRRLDAGAEHPYPLHAADLKGAVVWLEASPAHLSERMKLVESRLAGDDKMVLSAEPTAQAERFRQCPQVGDVRLWTFPFQSALQETQYPQERDQWQSLALMPFFASLEAPAALWKGRSYHLKGKLEGSPGAIEYYQMARPSNRQLQTSGMDPQTQRVFLLAKLDASYWLGLVSLYEDNPRAAIDYLNTRTLQVTVSTPWLHGAVYNLSRIFEGGDVGRAIGLYQSDADSPCYHGNLLRARWLEELTGQHAIVPEAVKQAAKKEGAKDNGKPGKQPAEKPTGPPAGKSNGESATAETPKPAGKAKGPSPGPAAGSAAKPTAKEPSSPQKGAKADAPDTGSKTPPSEGPAKQSEAKSS